MNNLKFSIAGFIPCKIKGEWQLQSEKVTVKGKQVDELADILVEHKNNPPDYYGLYFNKVKENAG